jgi:oligogalacturonide transport system substrate-binding protein
MKTKALKRILAAGMSILTMLPVFAGCGNTEMTFEDGVEEAEITFSWWGSDSRHEYTIAAIKAFEEQHPDIKVNLEYSEFTGFQKKMDVKMAAHTEADVMQLNYAWVSSYSPDGTGFYDLNQLSDVLDFSNYTEEALSYGTVNGTLNALPIAQNGQTFIYNSDLYEKYGLELPETWDDFTKAAAVMQKDGVYPLDLGSTAMWFISTAYVEQQTGKAIISDSGKFNFTEADVASMIEFYINWVDTGVIKEITERSDSDLSDGIAAGTVQWINSAEKYAALFEQAGGTSVVGTTPILSGATRTGWYVKPATMYAISANTEHPTEAGELLEFLVASEDMTVQQQLDKGIPFNQAAKEILQEKDMLTGIMNDADAAVEATDTILMNPLFETSTLSTIFSNACTSVHYGEATIEEAAKTAYEEMKGAL